MRFERKKFINFIIQNRISFSFAIKIESFVKHFHKNGSNVEKMFAQVITNSDLILQNLMTDAFESTIAQHIVGSIRAEPAFEWNI